MKLGETSILELPITWLRLCFPFINKYYAGSSRHLDAYEHCLTGIIIMLIVSSLMSLTKMVVYIIPIAFFLHVILKEVIFDEPKRAGNDPHEKEAFKVDLVLRISGFVFGSPFVIINLLRG